MKNIENLKKEYIEIFSNKYHNKSSLELSEDLLCKYSTLAEIWAYIISILPLNEENDIFKYTIFDFDGYIYNKKTGERKLVIPENIAANAKNIICKYCWGKTWNEIIKHFNNNKEKIRIFLKSHSVMMNRLKNGNNIVIFGESDIPVGKTMISSIIMKEAIKLRIRKEGRCQTYGWVDFSKLKYEITKETNEVANYKSCEWLVVDNIPQLEYSIQQKAYITDIFNSFFIDRFSNKLPTILVFKFDIRQKSFNIENEMGIGISKIVNNNRTYLVPLCEEFLID